MFITGRMQQTDPVCSDTYKTRCQRDSRR